MEEGGKSLSAMEIGELVDVSIENDAENAEFSITDVTEITEVVSAPTTSKYPIVKFDTRHRLSNECFLRFRVCFLPRQLAPQTQFAVSHIERKNVGIRGNP